jgi:hypothetical protein
MASGRPWKNALTIHLCRVMIEYGKDREYVEDQSCTQRPVALHLKARRNSSAEKVKRMSPIADNESMIFILDRETN